MHVLDGAAGPGRLELTEEMKQGAWTGGENPWENPWGVYGKIYGKTIGFFFRFGKTIGKIHGDFIYMFFFLNIGEAFIFFFGILVWGIRNGILGFNLFNPWIFFFSPQSYGWDI